jgi:hypothetical protein
MRDPRPLPLPSDRAALLETLRAYLLLEQLRGWRARLVGALAVLGGLLGLLALLPLAAPRLGRLALGAWALVAGAVAAVRGVEWRLGRRVRALAEEGADPPE